MSEIDVESAYRQRYERSLKALAIRLEAHLCDLFDEVNHIDRISARAKDPRRFAEKAGKAENGRPKYMHPFEEIQDQVGARITVLYESDVPVVEEVLVRYFHPVENLQRAPEDSASFGYFVPDEAVSEDVPQFVEIQIKTAFQHAWSETNHDIAYKSDADLTPEQERWLAFAAAQAWGADKAINELVADLGPDPEEGSTR
ncbi:MAG TPA: hypothetical protein P5254_04310 [Aquihabitans sp.]|nr:hypothetical protein [Aquihabitans sp.]